MNDQERPQEPCTVSRSFRRKAGAFLIKMTLSSIHKYTAPSNGQGVVVGVRVRVKVRVRVRVGFGVR